jgi:hypothetical protein
MPFINATFSIFFPFFNIINFKPRLFFFISFIFFSTVIYFGSKYFENGLSLNAFFIFLFFKIIPGLATIRLLNNYQFNFTIYFYLTIFFLLNLIFYPSLTISRELFWFPDFSLGNSTNYINVYALLSLRLIYFQKTSIRNLLFLFPLVLFSIQWDNRTGLLLSMFLFIFIFYRINKIYLLIIFIFLLILFSLIETTFYSNLRIYNSGLESIRWLVWEDAFDSIKLGEYFKGGFNSIYNDTIWMHNLWLDIYRLSGFYLFLISVISLLVLPILISIIYDVSYLVILICTELVAFTSVPLEGSYLEFLIVIGGILQVYFLISRKKVK